MAGFTYSTLTTAIGNYTEVGTSVLSSTITDQFIDNSELRILRDIPIDANRKEVVGNLVASNDSINVPANKLSKGTPSRYFVQRFIDKTTVTLYTTPDSTAASKDVHIYFVKRIQDVDATYTDATDVPFRFVPCMASGLAFYLAQKYAPQRAQELKLFYEDELARALSEDGSSTSVHILPKTYYPGT